MTDRLRLSCSDVDDLSALYVLDALGAAEAAEVAAHLADHPDRHAAFRELAGVTPFLAESVPPLAPPPDLRARVLAQVAATPQEGPAGPARSHRCACGRPRPRRRRHARPTGPAAAARPGACAGAGRGAIPGPDELDARGHPGGAAAPPAPISIDAAREAKRRRNPLWAVLAAAAVLAIVALGGWNVVLQQQQSQTDQRLAVLSAAAAAAGQPDAADRAPDRHGHRRGRQRLCRVPGRRAPATSCSPGCPPRARARRGRRGRSPASRRRRPG